MQISLSNSQAGPGRKVKQEQEEISREPRTSLFADLCTISKGARKVEKHVDKHNMKTEFLEDSLKVMQLDDRLPSQGWKGWSGR